MNAKKNCLISLLFFTGMLLSSRIHAQSIEASKDSVEKAAKVNAVQEIVEKDLIDISHKVLSYFSFRKYKHPILADSSKKESEVFFAFLPAVGYALQTGVTGIVATNISFFTSKKNKDIRLSSFTINPAFSLQHQIMVPIQSNIWFSKNKINLLGDWRYLLYPTATYGLGGQTSLANSNTINYSYVKVYQQASKRLLPNFYAGLGYGLDWHFGIKIQSQTGQGTDFLARTTFPEEM